MKNIVLSIMAIFIFTSCGGGLGSFQVVPNNPHPGMMAGGPQMMHPMMQNPYQQQQLFVDQNGVRSDGYNYNYRDRHQSAVMPVTPPGRNHIGFEEWKAMGHGTGRGFY